MASWRIAEQLVCCKRSLIYSDLKYDPPRRPRNEGGGAWCYVQNTTRHSHLPITIWIMMPSMILTIIHIMIYIMIHILIHMITIQHQDKSFSPWRAVATSPLGLLTGFISLFRLEIRSATQATRNEYNWSAAEDHDVYKTLNGKKLSPPDEHFPLNNFVLLMNIFN
jgi:hypothetical protein